MVGDTLHWIVLVLVVLNLVGTGAIFARVNTRWPRP